MPVRAVLKPLCACTSQKNRIHNLYTSAAVTKVVKRFRTNFSFHCIQELSTFISENFEEIMQNVIKNNKNDFRSCSTRLNSKDIGICKV